MNDEAYKPTKRKPSTVLRAKHGTAKDGRRVTYQRELVQCGKADCQKWHGPYWYAYWWHGKRVRRRYIGKVWRSLDAKEAESPKHPLGNVGDRANITQGGPRRARRADLPKGGAS